MAAEVAESTRGGARAGWRPWLRVAAIAVGLLLLSEALWLWQTWPVRDLLQPDAVTPAVRKS
jgi:hypothetical protein